MARLVVFADFVCPFCFLADQVAARLQRDGWRVEHAAFELRPAGTPLPSADEEWMRRSWERNIEPLATELGVEMRFPSLVTRTRKAHEAEAHARNAGRGDEMRDAIYRAYWQQGRDIGRIDVLSAIGGEIGLEPSAVRVDLDVDKWTDQVERERAAAARIGVRAVPAYAILPAGSDDLTTAVAAHAGLMRYEELRAWVEKQT